MNVAGNQRNDRTNSRALPRVPRQEAGFRVAFLDPFEDGRRLNKNRAIVESKRGHAPLRIDRAVRRFEVLAAIADEMHLRSLVSNTLQVECDPDPIGGGRTKII